MKIVLETKIISKINLFQNLTGVHVIDSLDTDDILYFVIRKGEYGLAVGRKGKKIRKAERIFKKTIRVFEDADDLETFVKNLIPEAKEIKIQTSEKNKKVRITVNKTDRAKVIGKRGSNIKIIKEFLQRKFDIDDIKVY